MTTITSSSILASPVGDAAQDKPVKSAKVFKEFEAVLLQGFVEAMFPDKAESVFGKGLAADTWKSLFAESIARELAESERIGLAAQLGSLRPIEGAETSSEKARQQAES